jgi:hypothetical protein
VLLLGIAAERKIKMNTVFGGRKMAFTKTHMDGTGRVPKRTSSLSRGIQIGEQSNCSDPSIHLGKVSGALATQSRYCEP